jgi:hypothetical protein
MNGPTSRGLCAASPMTPKRRRSLLPLLRFRPVAVLGVTGVAGVLAVAMGSCEPWLSFTPFAPRGLPEGLLLQRAQSQVQQGLRVSLTALAADETRRVVGFDLASRGIQPVWVKVVNREDLRYFVPPITIDSEYFSPLEVAWQGRRLLATAENRRIEQHLHRLALPAFVEPGSSISGYVFTNLDEGVKYANVELVGAGRRKVRRFSFLAPVPGLRTDFMRTRWSSLSPGPTAPRLDDEGLKAWLEKELPCCTLGGDRRTPGDPLNVVLVGPPEAVFPALSRRGWHVTQEVTLGSIGQTIHSALFGRRYRYAPVSPLQVFGRRQDIALQKGRSDVNQRNHMRLWLAPVTAAGTPVWVGQISRDIGVRLTRRTLTTHAIDADVDETRWYLLQDLFFSEALERFGLVGGVGAAPLERPRHNFTGDPYFTDGRRAVLWLTPRPVSYHHVATRWPAPRQKQPGLPACPDLNLHC